MDAGADVKVIPRASNFRWVVVTMIFTIYTIAAADRANIGFAIPFIRKEFPMTNTEVGGVLSLFLWGYALAQIPAGFATSRLGVKRLFAAAMICTSIFTGTVGITTSVLALKIYRFMLGLAEGPLPIGITTTINNWFPPKEKGTASGIFLSAVKFGPVIAPPACALIVSIWGWREIFFVCAVPGLILAAVWYLLVPDRPSDSRFCSKAEQDLIIDTTTATAVRGTRGMQASQGLLDRLLLAREVRPVETAGEVFRSWNLWGCSLGYCFQLSISNILLAWIPTYLLTVKKFSVMGSGFVAAAPWVGAVAGNILGGWISDRMLGKRRKPGMLFSALATAGMMYALINSPADPTLYGLLLFATGVLLSLGFSNYSAYPMGLSAKAVFPIASSMQNMGGQIGGAIGPLVVGILLDHYGWDYVFLFMAAGSLLSFCFVATIQEPLGT